MVKDSELTCEICGNPTYHKIFRIVEGVKMLVCPNCADVGEELPERKPSTRTYKIGGNIQTEPKKLRNSNKPAYDPHGSIPTKKIAEQHKEKKIGIDDLELKPDYQKILIKLRQSKNLSQAEFANSVSISETTYKAVEAKKIDLTILDAQKIEKKYNIKLTQEAGAQEDLEIDYSMFSSKKSGEYTLGDVLFSSKKK